MDGELYLRAAPVLDTATGACASIDARVWWIHPAGDQRDATDLLPFVDAGLRAEIDRWAVHEALNAVWRLRRVGHEVPVTVRIAGSSVAPETAASIKAALATLQLPPDALLLLISPDHVVDAGDAVAALDDLRALGVGMAVDSADATVTGTTVRRAVPVEETVPWIVPLAGERQSLPLG